MALISYDVAAAENVENNVVPAPTVWKSFAVAIMDTGHWLSRKFATIAGRVLVIGVAIFIVIILALIIFLPSNGAEEPTIASVGRKTINIAHLMTDDAMVGGPLVSPFEMGTSTSNAE